MEEQASSMEADQRNQIPPKDQAGSTSQNRPIPPDSAQVQGFEANSPKRIPPGFWFEPDDSVLILFYLHRKIRGLELDDCGIFREVPFYKHDPEELTRTKNEHVRDEWYFFTERERIGARVFKRETGNGSWKAVDGEKMIKYGGKLIGYRRSHKYFRARKKTEWLMVEYSAREPRTDTVICRVYRSPREGVPGIIPDLNRSPPNPGGTVKKRRFAYAPQAALPPHPVPCHCQELCTQYRESHEPETNQEKADDRRSRKSTSV